MYIFSSIFSRSDKIAYNVRGLTSVAEFGTAFFRPAQNKLSKKNAKFAENQQLSQAVVAGSSETQTKHARKSIPDFDKLRLLCY
jgi:hypothetical protein